LHPNILTSSHPVVSYPDIKKCALNLLARREHSQQELRQKLHLRNFDRNLVESILQELANQGLQSDQRFAECYARMRINKGYGPVRIVLELRQRGVADTLIDKVLSNDIDWPEIVTKIYRKKFGNKHPKNFAELSKQMRFLQYKGFTVEQLQCVTTFYNLD